MKTKIIGTLLAIIIVFSATVTMTGCLAPLASEYGGGHWEIDFEKSDQRCRDVIQNLTIDMYADEAYITITYRDGLEFSQDTPKSGLYKLIYGQIRDGESVYWLLNESAFFWRLTGSEDMLCMEKVDFAIKEIYSYFENLYLIKTKDTVPPKPEPDPDNKPDPDQNPDPDDPSVTDETHFEQIKTAYANAGYDIDVELGDIDQSLQSTVKMLKDMYAALGYDMSFIGKNLSNPMSMEFYMLITAHDKAGADEIAEAYDGTYPYAQHGRDIIISLSIFGEPYFDPFYTACE